MRAIKQSLLSVYKGTEWCTFPRLMNADKVRADNQTGITKGISLSERFTLICQILPSALWLVGSSPKNANKKVTLHRATPPTNPSTPHLHLTLSDLCPPAPIPLPPLSPLLVLSQLPHGLLWPILHLPKPTADAWCVKKVRSSGLAEALSLPLHRGGLPCGFIIICRWHSAQVQAQCKRWHQRGGMRLATHLVISCP